MFFHRLPVKIMLWLFFVPLFTPAGSHAEQSGLQSLQGIREVAIDFVRQHPEVDGLNNVQIETGRLDPRLRLAQCNLPIEAFPPQGDYRPGSSTVGVRCSGDASWTVYVQVKVKAEVNRVVLVAAMPRGAIVDSGDIKEETRWQYLSSQTTAFIIDMDQVIGKQTKRSLAAGTLLTTTMLQAPNIVQRGDRVTLVAGSGGLQVSMTGKALENGAVGDRIRVRNLKSKRQVEGLVQNDGSVRVSH